MDELLRWLQDLTDWLRKAIGKEVTPAFTILEHHTSKDDQCEAWLLCSDECDCGMAGMVACWYLRHKTTPKKDFLILCFNIAQIREAYSVGGGYLPTAWRRKFEVNARMQIKLQSEINASHLFMVCSVDKQAQVKFTGKTHTSYREIDCVGCYAIDLQGATIFLGTNSAAVKIVQAIAKRCTNILIKEGEERSWEEWVLGLCNPDHKNTWLTWLNHFCRDNPKTRIDPNHILQPPRAKSHFQRVKDEE